MGEELPMDWRVFVGDARNNCRGFSFSLWELRVWRDKFKDQEREGKVSTFMDIGTNVFQEVRCLKAHR